MTTRTISLGGDPVSLTYEGQLSNLQEKQLWKRAKRNSLLAESDSMVLTDRGLSSSNITKWKTYRQTLRNTDFTDPDAIKWPTKPT
jgi:hypothetical protein